MKTQHYYIWKTLWNGKMTRSRHHATEEEIRKSHPEAVRVDNTLLVREIPETLEERRAAWIAGTAYEGPVRQRADGSVVKLGEQP
ncbi:MAG: hypothetical protein H7274_26215 [Rhodoferax sp.]|nr:hypothetical protein [Rhodoferax sp.]